MGQSYLAVLQIWEDRSTCVLFGDAAGAVIVQSSNEPCGMMGLKMGSDGSQARHLILPAGGTVEPFDQAAIDNQRYFIQMNGRAVFRFASKVVGESCRAAVANAGISLDDIDWIIPHQANLRIIQAAARDMNVPIEKFCYQHRKIWQYLCRYHSLGTDRIIGFRQNKAHRQITFCYFWRRANMGGYGRPDGTISVTRRQGDKMIFFLSPCLLVSHLKPATKLLVPDVSFYHYVVFSFVTDVHVML